MVATAKTLQQTRALRHTPQLHPPWFADRDEGMSLHRYFDEQFVPRFIQQALSQRLNGTRSQDWYQSDRFGRNDVPTLRLPMHQTFYITCCEISCAAPGLPAFAPARIKSAGFVIRRRDASGNIQRWMLQEGQALGWVSGVVGDHEPDEYRRFVNSKLLQPHYPEPGYSGEAVYPLHTLQVAEKRAGKTRSHSLLWGYLPLGGQSRPQQEQRLHTGTPSQAATQALTKELSWPFGSRGARAWTSQDTRPCFRGYANTALYELLNLLLTRYRIFDAHDSDNTQLRALCAQIHFYPRLQEYPPQPFDPYAAPEARYRSDSLLAWIDTSRDALLEWVTNITLGKTTLDSSRLPQTTVSAGGSVSTATRSDDLYLSEQQAQTLRDSLLLRGGRTQLTMEAGLALPRFAQGDDDRFFTVPFVRYLDDCGCERIHWGQYSSVDFRVVSPLDPEAQRPRAIILPALADLKRGGAHGVTLLAPKSLADLLRKIKPDMDMSDNGPGNPCELCWNFGFSIPVVTICAMVLLTIVINLLNIIFFWLPWALLSVPRLCGKLLSENK